MHHREISVKIKTDIFLSSFKTKIRTWDGDIIHMYAGGNSSEKGVSHILENSEYTQKNGSCILRYSPKA